MLTQQLLSVQNISKAYGPKVVLDQVSLLINRGNRIGLVGENGTGKTTLATLILGELAADTGKITGKPGLQIGYLPQEARIDEETTVQAFLERAYGDLDGLRAALTELETRMAAPGLPPAELTEIMDNYGTLLDDFTMRGGYEADTRFVQVLAGLDLNHLARGRAMPTLSGGEKTRVQLAALLLGSPELLLLDEPTNHLDFAAIDWLEAYLQSYTGALLIISHDRRFLNQVCNHIAELTAYDHKLMVYPGNYESFIRERERLRTKQAALFEEQQTKMKELRQLIKTQTHNQAAPPPPSDGDKMLYDFKGAQVDKAKSKLIARAKQRLQVLEENAVEHPTRRWQINPAFDPAALGSRDVIRLKGISKAYGVRTLFEDVTATIEGGARIVLQGPNGLGKTTLLRLIMGIEAPDSGVIQIAGAARIGYLDQEQETLPQDDTVFDVFSRGLDLPETELRSALHKYGLFKEEHVFQPIHTLSIGQRRKLQIARLIAVQANVLLLDEPTNHLDPESVEQFERTLTEFPGTILATSHDRLFIERVATTVWTFEAGRLKVLG